MRVIQLRAPLAASCTSNAASTMHTCVATAARPTLCVMVSRRGFASHSIPVPSMGDSISEGTLVEMLVAVGGPVRVDDVVAKLDTDKVSVDIRSTVEGTVKAWHGAIGDTVQVGAALLDVEVGAVAADAKPATATQTPAARPDADAGEKTPAPIAQSGTQSPAATHPTNAGETVHRVPSIQFRFGKREARPQRGAQAASAADIDVDFFAANEAAAAALAALPARYKQRALKEAQLAVIELGGATPYESKKKAKA